jgi:hypothetical protein
MAHWKSELEVKQAVSSLDLGGVYHPLFENEKTGGVRGCRERIAETFQLHSVGRTLSLNGAGDGRQQRQEERAGNLPAARMREAPWTFQPHNRGKHQPDLVTTL